MSLTLSKGYTFGSTELVTSTKLSNLVDDATVSGDLSYPYVRTAQTSASLSLTSSHSLVVCDTTSNAIALTLPEAADNLGQKYTIFLETDGGNNLTVATTGSDVLNSSSNTLATLADAEDFIELIAVSDDRWLILNDNAVAYSTP